MECTVAALLLLSIGLIISILSSIALFLISPFGQSSRSNIKERSSAFRLSCWEHAVETSSSFLASVLQNPKVEPLVVNAITKAIDLWVSENSNDVKSTAKALPQKARGNLKVAMDMLDSNGVSKQVRENIMGGFNKMSKVSGKVQTSDVVAQTTSPSDMMHNLIQKPQLHKKGL